MAAGTKNDAKGSTAGSWRAPPRKIGNSDNPYDGISD
eukprot:CAMPEP_0176012932 /NCGR_PEP_ID=MMETSP0120_2-20121206/6049_1 /TAXON_ID=160619 /ORGANISM="Kryptoperidinium foliaceum, Strain CCMP 1326" /LENGTH=36 /DNA_ID= /DNA_START= /DNA_END= /DNA_ORIENTATION=